MTAVERVIEYCKLQPEAPLEIPKNRPDPSWPQSGNIAFKSMSLAYSQEMPIVLKNISCQIKAKEKVSALFVSNTELPPRLIPPQMVDLV